MVVGAPRTPTYLRLQRPANGRGPERWQSRQALGSAKGPNLPAMGAQVAFDAGQLWNNHDTVLFMYKKQTFGCRFLDPGANEIRQIRGISLLILRAERSTVDGDGEVATREVAADVEAALVEVRVAPEK
jgi:hypothetical protein